MKPFFEWVVVERRRRLFSGIADGERDLVESPSKVRRRQSAHKEMLLLFDKSSRQDLFEQRLRALFPELMELPQPASFEELLAARGRQ
jgi:hypothetical protein